MATRQYKLWFSLVCMISHLRPMIKDLNVDDDNKGPQRGIILID